MPKTRGESIFFTSITAWMMVYVMTLYNTVLATGTFTNLTFFIALKNMWIEYIIIGLLAYFVSGHLAKMCAFRVVQPGDRPIFIIFAIQTFTVIWQVAFASVISVFHGHGFTASLYSCSLILSFAFHSMEISGIRPIRSHASSSVRQERIFSSAFETATYIFSFSSSTGFIR